MDPITRIAKDTGVPREVLVKVVAKTVTEHRVIINDEDDANPDANGDHGELVSLREAGRRAGVDAGLISGWIAQGRLRTFSDYSPGTPRLVDADEVARLAAEPRKRGPRGPRKRTPPYLKPEYSGAR